MIGQEEKRQEPLTLKNLADLKRHIQVGTEIVSTWHNKHPDLVGLRRVVSQVQSNCFYTKVKDQPHHRWSACNYGQGFRSDFYRASNYRFNGTTVFVFVILRNKRINGDIDQNGIETNAVVSRVTETVSSDSDGMVSISHTYYVTYRAMNGQTVEAQLGSGKSVDFRIGKKTWDHDLQEGTPVRIKYLPEKTNYAIRVG